MEYVDSLFGQSSQTHVRARTRAPSRSLRSATSSSNTRENIDVTSRVAEAAPGINIFATLFFQRTYLSSRLEMLIDVRRAFRQGQNK
jgi:hypothetical protein